MNELLDSIEQVVVGTARRRARQRHRARVALVVVTGVLLLASAASAVTGTGPIGDALEHAPQPPGIGPPPGVRPIEVEDALLGERWTVQAFVAPPVEGGNGNPAVCVGAFRSGERSVGQSCSMPSIMLESLARSGIGVNSSARSYMPGSSVYGVLALVRADAVRVVVRDRGKVADANLSTGTMLVKRDLSGLRGTYRRQLERLPERVRVRAFVALIRGDDRPTFPEPRLDFAVHLRDGRVLRSRLPGFSGARPGAGRRSR